MGKQLFNISDESKSTNLEICVLGTLYVYKQGVGKPRVLFHHIFLGWATQRVSQHIPYNVFICLCVCTKLYDETPCIGQRISSL